MLKDKIPDAAKRLPQTSGLRAATAVARDLGVSDTTVWRWSKRGWLRVVNVCGRPYVDLASLADFDSRAAAGEFAQPAAGAARISADAKAAQSARREDER